MSVYNVEDFTPDAVIQLLKDIHESTEDSELEALEYELEKIRSALRIIIRAVETRLEEIEEERFDDEEDEGEDGDDEEEVDADALYEDENKPKLVKKSTDEPDWD